MDTIKHGMKGKTIKSVIRRKVDAWLNSIEDVELRDLLKKNVIVTGGCITSMLLGDEVNDYDIYFKTFEATEKAARYYVNKFLEKPRKKSGIDVKIFVKSHDGRVQVVAQSAGVAGEAGTEVPYEYFESRPDEAGDEYLNSVFVQKDEVADGAAAVDEAHEETEKEALKTEGKDYRPVFLTSNAITLTDKIQLVLRFYGEPDEIHKNYDFVHCTSYWTSWDSNLVLRPEALESILARELRYVGSKYPICSIVRLRKFMNRGWHINAGQILKMCMQISELDLTKIEVLQDQLTGVDAAYFVQVIDRLKEKDPEKIDSAYLVEIIDRIF